MKNEHRLVLLACIKDKNEEEKKLLDNSIRQSVNWETVAGQLYHHRLTGYFLAGLTSDQKKFVLPEFRKTMDLLIAAQKVQILEVAKRLSPIFTQLSEQRVRYAALKGLILNCTICGPGDRRSNDSDIMILEEDLDIADEIFRNHGFIQSFLPNGEYEEASRKEKMIQRMNYHDTVPYVKKHGENLVEKIEIDVNFHFDSKSNNITKQVYELGTCIYRNDYYQVQGLRWDTNLAYMCVHFFREGTNSIWTNNRRDVLLYKIVDVFNVFRRDININNIRQFIDVIVRLNLRKACFYTFFYIAQIYKDDLVQEVLSAVRPEDVAFLDEVYIVETKRTEVRNENYFDLAFNLNFCLA
jgi:hypothetical protein